MMQSEGGSPAVESHAPQGHWNSPSGGNLLAVKREYPVQDQHRTRSDFENLFEIKIEPHEKDDYTPEERNQTFEPQNFDDIIREQYMHQDEPVCEQTIVMDDSEMQDDEFEHCSGVEEKPPNDLNISLNEANPNEESPEKANDRNGDLFCAKCDQAFERKRQLQEHMKEHKDEYEPESNEDDSDFDEKLLRAKKRTRARLRKKHAQTDKENVSKPFKCDLCTEGFKKEPLLAKHKAKVHAPTPFRCRHCGFKFRSRYYLRLHLRTHRGPNVDLKSTDEARISSPTKRKRTTSKTPVMEENVANPFKCDLCDSKFRSKYLLRQHLRIHSGPNVQNLFKCDLCTEPFKTQPLLDKHKAKLHAPKQFGCPHCESKFRSRNLLQQHLRIHSGPHVDLNSAKSTDNARVSSPAKRKQNPPETPVVEENAANSLKCEMCNNSYKTKQLLAKHKAKVHAPKTFGCPHCDSKFRSNYYLQRHLRYHSRSIVEA